MPFSCCKYAVFEWEGETLSLIHFLSRCLFAPPLVEREIRLKHNCPKQFSFPCGVDKQGYNTSHISLPTFFDAIILLSESRAHNCHAPSITLLHAHSHCSFLWQFYFFLSSSIFVVLGSHQHASSKIYLRRLNT